MLGINRNRSNSAISLYELDSQSHARTTNRPSSSSTNWTSDPGDSQRQHEYYNESDQGSSEPRGVGAAVPPEAQSGDEAETLPHWPKPVSRIAKFWASHISCEVDIKTARDHLGTPFRPSAPSEMPSVVLPTQKASLLLCNVPINFDAYAA